MIRLKNLKAEEKLRSRRTEVILNYLRNDLDIWHRQVICWIDNRKTIPTKDVIRKLGIEVVQKLYIRKVLKKKDIDEMKFPEPPLTPSRSRSASPNRPTTPSDCQKKLDFNDDEDGYKVEADISHASCTCAHNENYYKNRISLLEKQKVELKKELQSKHIDGCPKCTLKEAHTQRYRAERNALREDKQRLENMLTSHAKDKQQHRHIESKFQHEVSNFKMQNSRADKKVANAEKDLEDMTTKCKEQQSIFNSKRCQLESEIKELKLELGELRKSTEYRWLTEEKAYQYNADDVLQIKNDLEVFKHRKKVLEDDLYEIQKENTELENEIQNPKSTLQQFDVSASNMSSLKTRIQDLAERSENMCIRLSEKDKELNHLKSVLNNAKFKGLELVADLDCGESMRDIEEENEKLQRNLSRLNGEIYKTNKGIALNAQLMSARNQKICKETSTCMSTGEGKIATGKADVNSYKNSENNESGSENASACSGNQMIMSSSSNFNSARHIVSEQHRTININANTVQISDNASINMSSNTSVDENRRHSDLEESVNQRQREIEN